MEHTAQHVSPLDRTITRGSFSRYWTLLAKTLMRSCVVVVIALRGQHTPEVPLTEDDDLVQALLPD